MPSACAHKLVVIGPRHNHRINVFEALASIAPPGSVEEEIIGFFSSLMEIESRSASKSSGEDTQFFMSHGQRLLGAILTCLRLAGELITAANIYRFLVSLPQTPAQLADAGWQAKYANKCMEKAFHAAKSPRGRRSITKTRSSTSFMNCARSTIARKRASSAPFPPCWRSC